MAAVLNNVPNFDMGGDSNNGGDGGGEMMPGGQGPLIGVDEGNDGDGSGDEDLSELFKAFADEEEDDDPGGSGNQQQQQQQQQQQIGNGNQMPALGDVPAEQVTALQTDIQNTIKGMRIPDNFIPDNFDPNDRAQLQSLLSRVVQTTVAQSLGVVFKPVQLGMSQLATQLSSTIDDRIRTARNGMQEQSILESIVPEINDQRFGPMIRSMDATLAQKGRKANDRAKVIRRMLNQMGINSPGGNGNNRRASGVGGQNNQNAGQSLRTGKAALDSFFGAFNPPQQGNQNGGGNNQNQNRR